MTAEERFRFSGEIRPKQPNIQGKDQKMTAKKIFLKLGPKFTSRAIAATLALLLCFGMYHTFINPTEGKKPSENLTEGEPNGNKTENIHTEGGEKTDNADKPIYSLNGAEQITTPLSSHAAILCNNTKDTVIRRKNERSPTSSAPVLALATALTVIDAITKGEVSPSDRAVCPASAIRLPCYNESSDVLSVGQSLTVAELVRIMLCTSPELFAYTLAIHICGSEEAFVSRVNTVLREHGATSTVFKSVTDAKKQTTTVLDAAIIFRAATEDNTLLSLLSSRSSFTVSASGSAWNTVTLCGRFYSECCTEGQAKADGIICGYYGEYDGTQFVFVLFEQLGTRYMTVALEGTTAYADSLILLSQASK